MALLRPLIYVTVVALAAVLIVPPAQDSVVQNVDPQTLARSGSPRHIEIDGSKIQLTLEAQLARAAAVVLVEATGKSSVHWNSRENKEWVAPDAGPMAMIYRDDTFRVVRVLSGKLQGREVIVRGVGGTIGDVTMTFDGQEDWTAGATYLVYLRLADTPTRDGSETMWVEVDIGQSAFRPSGAGRWINRVGQEVLETSIQAP